MTIAHDPSTTSDRVFLLWCRLTGNEPEEFSAPERAAFLNRPQVAELADAAYPILLDTGISTARRGALPLERWLSAVRSTVTVDA
jgi:hypothetical protein